MVTGAGGQLGQALQRRLPAAAALTRAQLDLTDAAAVWDALAGVDVVVNAAAYTAVDRAESDVEAAHAVNDTAVGALAEMCARRGAGLIHVSTDYVFDGTAGPYQPEDRTAPLGVYGTSKLAGEQAIRSRLEAHVILRTSWVYGPDRRNFVAAIVRQIQAGNSLQVVDDQRGGPTPTRGLANAIAAVLDRWHERPWGTWHVCGLPHVTWFGFARAILDAAGSDLPLEPVRTESFARAARRPADGRLDPAAFEARFGVAIRWQDQLDDVVAAWMDR